VIRPAHLLGMGGGEGESGSLPWAQAPAILWAERAHGDQSGSRLAQAGYRPGLGLRQGQFESDEQRMIYRHLVKHCRHKV
jgi:hypothetical protein